MSEASTAMLIDPALLPAYLAAVLALTLSPGPDTMFVMANGLSGRVSAALAGVLGIATGSVCHVIAAAFGISALVAASPLIFDIVRWVGGAYLFWLGIKALRAALSSGLAGSRKAAPPRPFWAIYRSGLATNLFNPKIIVFYLAFLPQFVRPELGPVPMQMIALGLLLNLIGSSYLLIVAYLSARTSARLLAMPRLSRWLDGVAGMVFLGLAARLALGQRPHA